MNTDKKISIPISRRFKFLQQKFLPVAVWLLSIAGVYFLAQYQIKPIDAKGMLETREVMISPFVDGTLQSLSVDLFDEVQEGDVVALMDDTDINAELIIAEGELAFLKSSLQSEESKIQWEETNLEEDSFNQGRRLAINQEEARLNYLDRVVEQETNKVHLARLKVQMEREARLLKENVVTQATYDDTKFFHEAQKKNIEENKIAIGQAKSHFEMTTQRFEEWKERVQESEFDIFLQPYRDNILTQEARITQIRTRIKTLILKTPLAGTVTKIFHRSGETVLSGAPLLAITDPQSDRIIAYVDTNKMKLIEKGTKVEILSNSFPQEKFEAKVIKVSPNVTELPIQLRRTSVIPEWGRPLIVGEIPSGKFIPGELVNLRFIQ